MKNLQNIIDDIYIHIHNIEKDLEYVDDLTPEQRGQVDCAQEHLDLLRKEKEYLQKIMDAQTSLTRVLTKPKSDRRC